MIKGIVVSADLNKNEALIKTTDINACTECKIGCALKQTEKGETIKVKLPEGIKEGDTVTVTLSPKQRIINSLILFTLPVAFLFLGFKLGFILSGNMELPGIISGFTFSSLSVFLIIKCYQKGFLDKLFAEVRKIDERD